MLSSCSSGPAAEVQPNQWGARGFQLIHHPDGLDVVIINHLAEHPDSTIFEFRTSPDSTQIRWPVQKIVTLSATQIGMVCLAEGISQIAGIDDHRFLFSPALRDSFLQGRLEEVAVNQQMDIEKILALEPDLVLSSRFTDGTDPQAVLLQEVGIPVLPIVEWQESAPLGRSAWALVVGGILGRYALTESKLTSIRNRYDSLRQLAEGLSQRPLVITGSPYKGTWYVPAGDSFIARLIRDAGAQTGWEAKKGSGSLALDPEAVFPIGMQAPFWIHPGTYLSLEELSSTFPEYQDFPSVQHGRVYNYYKQSLPEGANAYWEEGSVRPDLVLEDLLRIFHPDLLDSASFTYYHSLP